MIHQDFFIRVAHSCNHYILALESDAKLFDEKLKSFQISTIDSKNLNSTTTCNALDFDNDFPIEDTALFNLCE